MPTSGEKVPQLRTKGVETLALWERLVWPRFSSNGLTKHRECTAKVSTSCLGRHARHQGWRQTWLERQKSVLEATGWTAALILSCQSASRTIGRPNPTPPPEDFRAFLLARFGTEHGGRCLTLDCVSPRVEYFFYFIFFLFSRIVFHSIFFFFFFYVGTPYPLIPTHGRPC